jgi:lipid II:glycine glycyltransferase (peptidoglycan interpeptide bridge formation enzyme)
VSLTVGPISTAAHLAFAQAQRSVSFLQTPAWGRVKTEWRSESLGWYDGRQLVGAGLVLHRPVPRLERFTLSYLAEGPAIDWTGEIDAWLDPLAAYLKEHGAFAIRLGPPVRTAPGAPPKSRRASPTRSSSGSPTCPASLPTRSAPA